MNVILRNGKLMCYLKIKEPDEFTFENIFSETLHRSTNISAQLEINMAAGAVPS